MNKMKINQKVRKKKIQDKRTQDLRRLVDNKQKKTIFKNKNNRFVLYIPKYILNSKFISDR